MNSKYIIKKIDQEYNNEMLELFNRVFNKHYSIDDWNNKHFNNPIGETVFWGAFDGGKLVAISGFMPLKFHNKSKVYNVLEACEIAVDKHYRHQGIFSELIIAANEWWENNDIDFLIGLPNMFSYQGFIKLNWKMVSYGKSYGVITSLKKWIKQDKRFRPMADAILLVAYCTRCFKFGIKDFKVEQIDLDEFIKLHEPQDAVTCVYSKEFMEWKRKKNILAYSIKKKDENVLIVVCNADKVLYYEEKTDDVRILGSAWLKFVRCVDSINGMWLVYSESHSEIEDSLRRGGFATRREPLFARIFYAVSDEAKKLSEGDIRIFELDRD